MRNGDAKPVKKHKPESVANMCFQRVGKYAPTPLHGQRIFMKNSHDVLPKEAEIGLFVGYMALYVSEYLHTKETGDRP